MYVCEYVMFFSKDIHSLVNSIYIVSILKWSVEGTTILVAKNTKKDYHLSTLENVSGVAFQREKKLMALTVFNIRISNKTILLSFWSIDNVRPNGCISFLLKYHFNNMWSFSLMENEKAKCIPDVIYYPTIWVTVITVIAITTTIVVGCHCYYNYG